MPKRKGERYYRSGNKYRVHGYNKEGKYRILRWETIPEDLREFMPKEVKGKFRIVEWTINFIPTRDARPSSPRNWEVRLQLPEGYNENDIQDMAEGILSELCNEEMVMTSTIEWGKRGEDVIEYSDEQYIQWKVIDNARPQYKYPSKTEWGSYYE